ncbi:hypothetical protein B4U84_26490 [Westiellopsis prolifica IICB1]|nr:hypothetical protein B4U84_26490 [Westiellopsis prolifica IICB1]
MNKNSENTNYELLMKKALLQLKQVKAKLNTLEKAKTEPIAIIGLGCRFPGGVNNPEAFWQLLHNGVDAITEVPKDRWDIDAYYDPDPDTPGKMYTRYGGFINQQLHELDSHFFGISPREAMSIDPQQRLLLEVSWEALENSGVAPEGLAGSQTGVFIGISTNDYYQILTAREATEIDAYLTTGLAHSVTAGRLSYFLGLQGPSLAVDTACSSSLVTVHLACQSLRSKECNLALAGGVNRILLPEIHINFSRARMLSPDGRCKTFDASANGIVRSEGCGIVVLKRLSDALADRDNILALIRGSAVNQDGYTSGLTVPNGLSQQTLIRQALENAGVESTQVNYVEAHGTGTSLGDPIEVRALGTVLGKNRSEDQPLLIGSVKTNLGHLEAAAGVTGLMKVVLSLQHEEIPPHLHFQQPNPLIDWDQYSLMVANKSIPWLSGDKRRIAGVSSFGFSGTNAHVVLEEAPKLEPLTKVTETTNNFTGERPAHLLTLSAKTQEALKQLGRCYENHLATHPTLDIEDICFSANTGRSHFNHRLCLLTESSTQAREILAALIAGKEVTGVFQGQHTRPPKVAFLFTGQGSQYADMGKQLYSTQPTFRATLDRCDEILRPYLEKPLLKVLFPESGTSPFLEETAYTQSALFALEYALFQLWTSWGIQPSAVMGHSVGEYVAATVAGVFSLEDGLKLVALRGRLMQALSPNGEMVVVMADEIKVKAAIELYVQNLAIARSAVPLAIAAINGPQNVVISGERQAVQTVVTILEAEGVKTTKLKVSHAFHSPLMKPMLAEFEKVARQVTYSSPQINLISNLTGQWANAEIANPEYWLTHVLQSVQFAASMKTLYQEGYEVFVECGPKPTLLGMGRQCLPDEIGVWLPSLRSNGSDWQQILQSLARLYVQGIVVDWSAFDKDYSRPRLVLPTYPWQRQRYWIEKTNITSQKTQFLAHRGAICQNNHPLLGQRLYIADSQEIRFEAQIRRDVPAYLEHHCVYEQSIFPGAGYIEMALAAGTQVFKSDDLMLEDVSIQQALLLPADEVQTLQLSLTPQADKEYLFQIFSWHPQSDADQNNWVLHASGRVRVQKQDSELAPVDLARVQAQCAQEISVTDYYQQLQQQGLEYSHSFQAIEQLWRHPETGEALGQIRLAAELVEGSGDYKLHPVLLDACFQVVGAAIPQVGQLETYLPIGLERLHIYQRPASRILSHVQVDSIPSSHQKILKATVRLFTIEGQLIAMVSGLRVQRADRDLLLSHKQKSVHSWLYQIGWQSQALWSQQLSPDYLQTPKQICNRLQSARSQMMAQPIVEVYAEGLHQLEALSLVYVISAFQQLGWDFSLQERFSTTALAQQLGIVNQHHHLLNRLLEMLAEEGILQSWGQDWEVVQTPTIQSPDQMWSSLVAKYPTAKAELTLLQRCGSQLALVLRGKSDPIQLLFPEGDLTTTTQLYQDSPGAQIMNSLVQKAIALILEQLPLRRSVRVLEIGAGTGGTTSYLLPHLNPEQTEYVFTDISTAFTTKAANKYQNYPFVSYQVLDIEADPVAQGFTPHQFDIILAAHVIHATADLQQSLNHIQKLLTARGMLVLLEGTGRQRWADLIFGLTEGWWRFTDRDLRPNYPLIPCSQWQKLLLEMGWQEVITVAENEFTSAREVPSAVIVAQAPQLQTSEVIPTSLPRHWLILADQQGLGQQLTTQLLARGEVCSIVFPGKQYQSIGKHQFYINPAHPHDWQQLLQAVQNHQLPLHGVVHLWSLDAIKSQPALTCQDLKLSHECSCGSALYLVQALLQARLTQPPCLWLVTQGAMAITQSFVPGLTQSPLWGMGKVIAQEHPELKCVRVDVDSETITDTAQALLEEIWFSTTNEDQVAFCNQKRYVARLESFQPIKTAASKYQLPFREDGTYLITGGLGGLGLLVAGWMVEHGARQLVLVGRSQPSPHVNAQLQELQQAGAKVLVAEADVAQTEQLARVLSQIEENALPPLRGIIHAAGVLDDAIVLQQSWERLEKVMAPKVQGAWNLHTLTLHQPLDFFVLFSSVASLLGSPGQSNHAAANAFLDALAHYRQGQGLPGLSINWGAVAQVGAFAERQTSGQGKMRGTGTIAPQEVLEVLELLFSQSATQVGVVPINWSQFQEQSDTWSNWSFLANFQQLSEQPTEQQSEFLQQLEAVAADNRRAYLIVHVCSHVATVLGLNRSQTINPQQGFFEQGMDSLMSVELRNRLQKTLACSLPSTLAFDNPTVEAVADYLIREVLTLEFSSKSSAELQQAQEVDGKAELLESLSQDEIADLLAKKLATLG